MREVYYHDWLSNPVMDCYPLPEIDWKVESLCGYPFKCFLEAYKGYHQIQMAESDEEKTAFHTPQGSSGRDVPGVHDQSGRDKTVPRQDRSCVATSIPLNNQGGPEPQREASRPK
ncbi:hypothetical protein Tco_0030735 [Tanacetum coccineum]